MTANPILLQKKYSRVIECFAKQQGLSLDAALDFFYHSQVYQLIRDGVSDMHCMSDAYLAEELKQITAMYHSIDNQLTNAFLRQVLFKLYIL